MSNFQAITTWRPITISHSVNLYYRSELTAYSTWVDNLSTTRITNNLLIKVSHKREGLEREQNCFLKLSTSEVLSTPMNLIVAWVLLLSYMSVCLFCPYCVTHSESSCVFLLKALMCANRIINMKFHIIEAY